MRWKRWLQSVGLVIGLVTAAPAGAQEINALDLEAALSTSDRSIWFWPDPFDNRATRKR